MTTTANVFSDASSTVGFRVAGLHASVEQASPLPAELADLLREDLEEEEDAEDERPGPRALENLRLRGVVGERLIEARRACGFDQCEFARAMNFANSTQVSLWEQGKRLPPLPLLIRAARVLGVSVDFLTGESEEPERDAKLVARAAVLRRVGRMLTFNSEVVAQCLLDACASPAADELRVSKFASRARALVDAVDRFRALHAGKFNELRAGATLARTASDMEHALGRVERYLHRAAHSRANAIVRARDQLVVHAAERHGTPV